jgi:DNA-binding NarL/FixJ family response regulator
MSSNSVLLVTGDHSLEIRLASWLEAQPDFLLAGVAGSVREAADRHWRFPDVLLVDLSVPDAADQLAWISLRLRYPANRLIVLFAEYDDALSLGAVAGARSFLPRDANPESPLWSVLLDALKGTPFISDEQFFQRLWASHGRADDEPPGSSMPVATPEHLMPRERDVLKLLAEAMSNKDIAAKLCLSETTVKHRVSDILSKLGVSNRTRAAVWAREHGLESHHNEPPENSEAK